MAEADRHSPDLIDPDQPPFWRFAGNERFRFHEANLRQVYGSEHATPPDAETAAWTLLVPLVTRTPLNGGG